MSLGKPRVDRIDEPARPLGAKRAALQLRRRRKSASAGSVRAQSAGTGALTSANKDAVISFALRATTFGLLIERTYRQIVGNCLVQTMVFADHRTFERWCDSEPIRFDDPLLFERLLREGHEALIGRQ